MFGGTAGAVLQALQAYDVKSEGAGKYRSNSPLRVGSNSHAFTLTIEGDEFGAWHDKVTDEGGSLYDLANKLGIALPERHAAADTKRAYSGLDEYAQAHGISTEELARAKWTVTTHQGRPALMYPTQTGNRFRFLDGDKPHYINEKKGYMPCWYGLKRAVDMALGCVVLCNGEISTIAAQYHGVPAFSYTSGEKQVKPELVQELRAARPGRVIIAFDCDEAGRRGAEKVAAQLADLNPVIVDLGFGVGGDLADFCMLHGEASFETLVQLADSAPVTPQDDSEYGELASAAQALAASIRADKIAADNANLELLVSRMQAELDRVKMHAAQPVVISFRDLARENVADVQERIDYPDQQRGIKTYIPSLDGLFDGFEAEVYTILGATNMGKSSLAVTLAAAFQRQGPGLIVPTESNPHRWMHKLVAALTNIPSHLIEKGRLDAAQWAVVRAEYARLEGVGCHMIKSGSPTINTVRAALLKGIQDHGYEWCIVDSGSKMEHPGATAIYDITRGVYNGLQTLMQDAGVPIFVTSQVGREIADRPRGQKRPRLDDAYGGGVIEQNSGAVFGIYHHEYYVSQGLEEPDPMLMPGEAQLTLLKSRWTPRGGRNTIRMKFIGGVKFAELQTVTYNDLTANHRSSDSAHD